MEIKNQKKVSKLMELFDAMFILLLCFGTLLTTMLLKGAAAGGMNYDIHITTLSMMFIGLILYVSFVLTHSEKGLKGMIKKLYADQG